MRVLVCSLLTLTCFGASYTLPATFGGSGASTAAGLARDAQGNLYVVGTTNSTDLLTVNPLQRHLGTAPLMATADAGKTWTFPLLAGASAVTAIVAAPSAPGVEYAVTSVGVFRSADGGSSWTKPASSGLVSWVTALAVDANSANTLYGATAQGVYVSTDGAASWQTSTSGIETGFIAAIAAHPTQAGTVLALALVQPPCSAAPTSARPGRKC